MLSYRANSTVRAREVWSIVIVMLVCFWCLVTVMLANTTWIIIQKLQKVKQKWPQKFSKDKLKPEESLNLCSKCLVEVLMQQTTPIHSSSHHWHSLLVLSAGFIAQIQRKAICRQKHTSRAAELSVLVVGLFMSVCVCL